MAEISEASTLRPLALTPLTPMSVPEMEPPEELTLTLPWPNAVTLMFCCAMMSMLPRAKMRPLMFPLASSLALLAMMPEPPTLMSLSCCARLREVPS